MVGLIADGTSFRIVKNVDEYMNRRREKSAIQAEYGDAASDVLKLHELMTHNRIDDHAAQVTDVKSGVEPVAPWPR